MLNSIIRQRVVNRFRAAALLLFFPAVAFCIDPADFGFELQNKATATVTVNIIAIGTSSFSYSYNVANQPTSERAIWEVALQLDIPFESIHDFQSPTNWHGPTCCKRDVVRQSKTGISAISWWYRGVDRRYLPAGETASGFGYVCSAIPAIKRFFVTSFTEHIIPQAELDPTTREGVVDPVANLWDFFNSSTSGITVGPEAIPPDATPSSLLSRLISLKHQSVTLGWLRGKEFIKDLDEKLDQAKRALTRNKPFQACKKLEQFIRKLEQQRKEQQERQHEASKRGKEKREEHSEDDKTFLNDNAFFLLKTNAEFIDSKLPAKERDEDKDEKGGDE